MKPPPPAPQEIIKGSEFDFQAGDVLFREGDPWDGLYLIKKGNAEVFRERNGRTIRLALLVPREFIGTVTIFSREPRVAGVRALTDLTVQYFDPEFVHQNFGTTNPAVNGFMRDIVSRLKDINRQYTDVVVGMSDATPAWMEVLRHARQLAYLLIVMARSSSFSWEEKTCVPAEGLAGVQRNLFSFREGYGEALFQLLAGSGLLTLGEVPARGLCLIDPSLPKLQAFLEFADKGGSLEIASFDGKEGELVPVLRLLDGLMGTLGAAFSLKKLLPLLEKVLPDAPGMDSALSLAIKGFLSILDDGRVRLNGPEILRYLHFNAILAGAHALTPEFLPFGWESGTFPPPSPGTPDGD